VPIRQCRQLCMHPLSGRSRRMCEAMRVVELFRLAKLPSRNIFWQLPGSVLASVSILCVWLGF